MTLAQLFALVDYEDDKPRVNEGEGTAADLMMFASIPGRA